MTGSLHTLVTVLRAPSFILSDQDGQIRAGGLQGWFTGDRRALAQFESGRVSTLVAMCGTTRSSASSLRSGLNTS